LLLLGYRLPTANEFVMSDTLFVVYLSARFGTGSLLAGLVVAPSFIFGWDNNFLHSTFLTNQDFDCLCEAR